jgi:hypothetical protein
MARSYGQLGLLAEAGGDLAAALDWTVRCVALLAEMSHPMVGKGVSQLAPLVAKCGLPSLEQSWQRCSDQPLPASVRTEVERMMREAGAG